MKTLLLAFFVISVALMPAQTASKKSKKTTAPVNTGVIEIPKGATLGDDGSYHFTDTKGKKWLYRKTPFGVARSEDKPLPQGEPAAAGPELTKATVVGDTVKFERPNAFGISRWEKKTADLTDDEKKIVENQRAKQQ